MEEDLSDALEFEEPNDSENVINKIFQDCLKCWTDYFTSQAPLRMDTNNSTHKILILFCHAIQEESFLSLFRIESFSRFFVDVTLDFSQATKKLLQMEEKDELASVLLEVFNNLTYEAEHIIKCLQVIFHQHLSKGDASDKLKGKKVDVKIQNFPQIALNEMKAHMVDNFVSFEATVIKVYQFRLMPMSAQFLCFDCKSSFTHYFTDGNYSVPVRCKSTTKEQCKGKTFQQRKESLKTIFYQRIKVQEIDSEGRVPRQCVCELKQNLVGRVITGENVKLSGIIKTETADEKDKKFQGIFTPYLMVNCLTQKIKGKNDSYDMTVIEEMRSDPNIFYSLLKSFCPTIFGHEIVKVGILLGIVGGSSKNLMSQSTFRETSHILLLGDPGLGKSQMLKFAVQLLPHSIYVSATSISTSGMTVTVNKDGGEQSLEAGALLLADNGVCAIDEFDKAPETSSLLEVMEQQTISIAKAGIICQLKCRVGILASANPVNGAYNKSKTFKDNTKITNAILSRFDLIFLLLDKPDPDHDKKLSEHIMKIHNKRRKKAPVLEGDKQIPSVFEERYNQFSSLREKYSYICEHHSTKYDLVQMKEYIKFVRNQIHPMLSREASEVIKGFFLALRENNPSNSFQITNRQLESMIRLSMAKARLECRDTVTEDDAMEICQLMQESLFDSFEEMGYNINNLKEQTKKVQLKKKPGELSLPKQRNIFISRLREVSEERECNIWEWGELLKLGKDEGLNIGDFYNFIERLNMDGVLLSKGSKKYAFQDTFL